MVELVRLPGEAHVGAVQQLVGEALRLEVLHGHNDPAVVAHVVVVVALQHLKN